VPLVSLRAVLDYLLDDERTSYRESPRHDHIYRSLSVIDVWVEGLEREQHATKNEGEALPLEGPLPKAVRMDSRRAVVEVPVDDAYWGVCPFCLRHDGYLNLGRSHWFVCHADRVRWSVGENLFSTWRQETNDDWNENWERIGTYTTCRPLYVEEPPPHR